MLPFERLLCPTPRYIISNHLSYNILFTTLCSLVPGLPFFLPTLLKGGSPQPSLALIAPSTTVVPLLCWYHAFDCASTTTVIARSFVIIASSIASRRRCMERGEKARVYSYQ